MILITSLILVCNIFLISAAEISTDSYNVESYHTGLATSSNSSTDSYNFRSTLTYQQGSNRDVATTSYSANSGWLNNSLYINTDELAAEPVCDIDNLNLCQGRNACENVGGYWYNAICNEEAEPTTPSTPSTESPGGGGGITGKITKEVEEEKIKVGTSLSLMVLERGKFTFTEKGKGYERFIEILDITENSALIIIYPKEMQINKTEDNDGVTRITGKVISGEVIYSEEIDEQQPISFRLIIGERKFLDLTNDGSRDIYIELEKIENYRSYIYIESIEEGGYEGELETTKPGKEEDVTKDEESSEMTLVTKTLNKMYFIIFGSLIIVFILIYFLFKHKTKIAYLEGGIKQLKRSKIKRKISLRRERRISLKIDRKVRKISLKRHKIKRKIAHKRIMKGAISKRIGNLSELGGYLKKSRTFIIIIFVVVLISIISLTKENITGFVSNNDNLITNNLFGVLYFFLIIGILGFLTFIQRKNIKRAIEYKKRNKHPTDRIKGLMKKEVYSEQGEYVGKVEEIILDENKIDSLKIKFNKKHKKSKPETMGIIIDYKDVRDTGHIVIMNHKIIEKIKGES